MNREQRRAVARQQRQNQSVERKKKTSAPKKDKAPFFKRVVSFFREVRIELQRVSWPTREQMVAFTIVTIITTAVLTAYIFGIDTGFRTAVFKLLELGR